MVKAWFYEELGSNDVLKLGEVPLPDLKDDQLLIHVRAAALNPIDFKRRQFGLFPSPFPVVPGADAAGVVVKIGAGVSRFKVGDEVYGNIQPFINAPEKVKSLGTLAEFILAEEYLLAAKPANLSFEEAASLPLAFQTALEGFKTARFVKGQSVLVVGGAGGVGSLAIQIAKHHFGASKVYATTSTPKLEFVKGLGADEVVDYTNTKYEDIGVKFDFVFDTIGDSTLSRAAANGGAPVVDITKFQPEAEGVVFSSLTATGEILEKFRPYFENGKIEAVLDPTSPYHFDDVKKAFDYLEKGRARGKVVIAPFPNSPYVE